MIKEQDWEYRTVGRKINIMFSSLGREQRFTMRSEALEVVAEYVYFGQVVTTDLDKSERTWRTRIGWDVFDR